MKHMPMIRSRYAYQQYSRTQITNTIRTDLRQKLKEYSINEIHEPEAKIYDMILEYFLNNDKNKEVLTKMVKSYY